MGFFEDRIIRMILEEFIPFHGFRNLFFFIDPHVAIDCAVIGASPILISMAFDLIGVSFVLFMARPFLLFASLLTAAG